MKEKILAIALLILVIGSVTLNTIFMQKAIDESIKAVREFDVHKDNAKKAAEEIFDDYKSKRQYISITVNHEDLTSIEDSFVELISYLSIEDTEGAEVAKSRLIHFLLHLRRLSGVNIDSII